MSPPNPRRPNRVRAPSLPLALLLVLAGCGPLVQIGGNDPPPASLLSLRATAVAAPGASDLRPGHSFVVVTPVVPGPLQTLRLPVTTGDTTLVYLVGATWAEQPNRLFGRVLADTLSARGNAVLPPRAGARADARTLAGTLLDFGLDVRASPQVRVRFDAVLTDITGKPIAARRFEATEPVSTQLPEPVAAALNVAANRVAGDVADWAAGQTG